MKMFTKTSAIEFVREKLHVDVDELLVCNLKLLNAVIRAFYKLVPFNNFWLLSLDVDHRARPTLEHMHKQVTSLNGGLCITLNTVFKHLLDALGYKAFYGWGHILHCAVKDPHHMMILVEDVEKDGDVYYVDVGFGFPTFEAVDLDELPKTFQFGFHYCKLENDGENIIRYHKKNATMGTMVEDQKEVWEPFIILSREHKELQAYNEAMDEIYTSPMKSVFLNVVYAAVYPEGKAITLRDLILKVWNETSGNVETKTFETVEEALNVLVEYYPNTDKTIIERALVQWENCRDVNKDTKTMV